MNIQSELKLPCVAILKNRIAKAAMTERLAGADHLPNAYHETLYKHWAQQDAGLLISGNVIVDKKHLESANNVVVGGDQDKSAFSGWIDSATSNNTHFWAQISHAGRQANIFSNLNPKSASDVKLKKLGFFAKPVPMTVSDIEEAIHLFVDGAAFCKDVGFTGIQFHAAHGYLLSQFLSPRTNKRQDQWGGSIENRSKLLFEIVEQSRKKLGPDYPVSVKINSADFQRGGFEEEDAIFVIKGLAERGIDLLEISGGTYENLVFITEQKKRDSTKSREAYFMDFAKKVREVTQTPLMVTGGFRTKAFMNEVLENGELDVVGCARPFLLDEHFPKSFFEDKAEGIPELILHPFSDKYLDLAEGGYYDRQIESLAKDGQFAQNVSANGSIIRFITRETINGIRNRLFT